MKKIKIKCPLFLTILLLITVNIQMNVTSEKIQTIYYHNCGYYENDFYFVQITDTHVINKKFDKNGSSIKRLRCVLENITSFKIKPAFIVVTGDLVEWGGSSKSGELNYQAFISCFYKKNDILYADSDYSIPVYTIPGNHDYVWENNLENYHKYVDKKHVDINDKYTITYKDVSLFFMNSGFNYVSHPTEWKHVKGSGLYNEDIKWLEKELKECRVKHKIILMHHPAVNSRDKNDEMTSVIARNREKFIELCEQYNVELVLTGHTHTSRVFDAEEKRYSEYDLPFNCSMYPTLYVQTDDCKEGVHYRNISVVNDNVWLEKTQTIEFNGVTHNKEKKKITMKTFLLQQVLIKLFNHFTIINVYL